MRGVALILLVAACGGAQSESGKSSPPNPDSDEQDAHSAAHEEQAGPRKGHINAGSTCEAQAELHRRRCGPFGEQRQSFGQCVAVFGGDPNGMTSNPMVERFARCILSSNQCEHVLRCLNDLGKPDRAHLRACGDPTQTLVIVGVSAQDYARRNGNAFRRLSQVQSSAAHPIERCGLDDGDQWLASLECDDGTWPLDDPDDPHRNYAATAQVGSVTRGGRCDSPIEHFAVRCPHQPITDIYVDPFVCPKE